MPPVAPALGWVNRVRLGRDYYVRVDGSDYSVDPAVNRRFVDVHPDQARVEAPQDGRHDALVRDLADYDRAFGLTDGLAGGLADGEVA